MAGCSVVMLTILTCLVLWPVMLLIAVLYLVFEAAALVVTSPAFPWIIVAMLSGMAGCIDAALVLWRRYRNPDGDPLSFRSFIRTLVLFAISCVAICVAFWQLSITVYGVLSAA